MTREFNKNKCTQLKVSREQKDQNKISYLSTDKKFLEKPIFPKADQNLTKITKLLGYGSSVVRDSPESFQHIRCILDSPPKWQNHK